MTQPRAAVVPSGAMRWCASLLVVVGCAATPPAPKTPFAEAMRRTTRAEVATTPAYAPALDAFLASAQQARAGSRPGAPMPEAHARAWRTWLDATDAFLAERRVTRTPFDAPRLRLQLETELQTDAQAFGHIPAEVAERVPPLLARLSRRIATQAPRARAVDPRRFRWPVAPLLVTSPYGARIHPIAGEPRFHAGVDLEAPLEHPVRAAEAGVVVFSGWNGAHGQQVELQHDAHWTTRYSHLDALVVKPGARVQRGELLGLAGETGLATGPHLHFELRRDGDALDPEAFLGAPEGGPLLVSERTP